MRGWSSARSTGSPRRASASSSASVRPSRLASRDESTHRRRAPRVSAAFAVDRDAHRFRWRHNRRRRFVPPMAVPAQLRALLEAGVHFGHQTRRWNPKMRRFIFAERNGIYIIDLNKTLRQLERAKELVGQIVGDGGRVLFVCTKRQLKDVVREEAERCSQFFVTERWLGGTLTNFRTIKKNLKRLKEIERMRDDGTFELLLKKEVIKIEREYAKLKHSLGGIADMEDLPGAVFVVDAKKERIAVAEA